jgi:cytochrome c-type protein NapC
MTAGHGADSAAGQGGSMIGRAWRALWRPSVSHSVAALLLVGFIGGIGFWGAFNWSLELTNTETFCITCHEMERNVFREYSGSVHDANGSGVRASCPDCHVPRPWIHKVARKI